MAKKKGLWSNIHAKRNRGESPAKKGDKNYPETLDIGEGAERLDEISKKLARSYVDKATADRDKNAKDWKSTGSGEAFNKAEDREKNIQRASSKLYKGTPAGKIMGTKNPAKVSATGKDPAEPKENRKGIKGLVKKLTRKEEFVNEGLKKARNNVGADTCWDGYKAKGTKKKDGKEVPNCVKEGKIADRMRANLKVQKKSWDEKGEKAKKDGYDALDKVKKTQADLDNSDFTNNIKEGKSFAEFCAEGKSRIETDPDYRKRFKALADNFAEKRKEQTKAKKAKVSEQAGDGYIGPPNLNIKNPMASDATRAAGTVKRKAAAKQRLASGGKTSGGIANRLQQRADMINSIGEDTIQIEDSNGEVVAEITDLILPEPMTGWKQQIAMEDWSKKNKGDKVDGMGKDSIKAYRRENPGSKLKGAVTGDPKKGSKDAGRRKNYCDRSKGQQDMHNIDCSSTPDKPICKARKRWKC